jgi:hypothetical protein
VQSPRLRGKYFPLRESAQRISSCRILEFRSEEDFCKKRRGMVEAQALGFVLHRAPIRQTHFRHVKEQLFEPTHGEALSFLETWQSFDDCGGMILGQHFPTRRWSGLLPHIALLEKIPGRDDFRVRLLGFGLFCFYGFDLRGKRLSQIHDEECYRARFQELEDVLATGRPHVSRASLFDGDETMLAREILSLPVLASDGCTRLVLVASFWTDRRWLN